MQGLHCGHEEFVFLFSLYCEWVFFCVFMFFFPPSLHLLCLSGDMITSGEAPSAVAGDELRSYAAELGIDESHIWETSAKTGSNINDLFETVALEYQGPEVVDPSTVSPENPKPAQPEQSSCAC